MGLHLFNTLSRNIECFTPLLSKHVRLYCCGPTVHDFAHIGNFRTFVFSDLLVRYLRFRGYKVMHVMNITDVEDKIVTRVKTSNMSLQNYTSKYETAFFEDMKDLSCMKPDHIPHVSNCIEDIVMLIERLIQKGIAYHTSNGSVYFSIQRYKDAGHVYGQLTKIDMEQMQLKEGYKSHEFEKKHICDFALWKARIPEDGDVFWESPWGEGRPGWHIECSAMSMKLLGASFDIHIGGEDLIFPHHEDEIAQSEGASYQSQCTRFVKYWMHVAHLLVEGKKMSKSLNNFYTLRDLLHLGFSGRELRFALLSAHYRESFNFTLEGLKGARNALRRIDECVKKLKRLAQEKKIETDHHELHDHSLHRPLIDSFTAALDDDLNVSSAWAVLFDWVREMNRRLDDKSLQAFEAAANLNSWKRIEMAMGIFAETNQAVPASILRLMNERESARRGKDYARADALRQRVLNEGWMIEDTPKGPRAKQA